MSKKVIICDIEGCLTVNKGEPVCIEALVKIANFCKLARKGIQIPFVLCTGRPQPYAEAMLQTIGAFFPGFPSIVENGCFLYNPVKDVLIPNPSILGKEDALKNLADFIDKKFIYTKIAKREPGKEFCISLNPIGKMSVKELYSTVLAQLPKELKSLIFITYSSSAVDFTPAGVNKASGLAFFVERTGIPFAEMIGIGDTRGDFSVLEKVGYPACPSNASKEVKELVIERKGFVAPSPNASGVWDILLHYNLVDEDLV